MGFNLNIFVALRPKHWVKNLFILLPLVFGQKLLSFPENLNALLAFCLFCLASSAAYLINDVLDFERDRIHPVKCLRPIASEKISVWQAVYTALILGAVTIIGSFYLNTHFGFLLVIYLFFNFLYSKILKNMVIVDVFCISAFFLLRIAGGSVVTSIVLSHWIIMMTLLLTLFLGFNKRRQELGALQEKSCSHRQVLSKYDIYFIDQMISVITSSIVIAYMLYTVDANTIKTFGSKNLIFTIPFVYYGIFRYLYLIHKVKMDGDPTQILFKDRKMRINIFLWIVICVFIIYL